MSEAEKKPGGRPAMDAVPVTVRVPAGDLARLDTYIAAQPDPKPSRPEAIGMLLREGLAGKGMVPPGPAAIEEKIGTLEAELAAHPPIKGRSPKAALRAMKRAVAENELADLRHRRKRQPRSEPN